MKSALRYMLDTNIISRLMHDPAGPLTSRIRAVGEFRVCTSIIVAAELRFGGQKKGSAGLIRRIETILSALPVLPLEPPAEKEYARLRSWLESAGTPIGPNDMLIAAHALSCSLVLVTANDGEFSRVPDLEVENWLM